MSFASLTNQEIIDLRRAVDKAIDDDSRTYFKYAKDRYIGQCYVVASWLQYRLGGHVIKKHGHFVWTDGEKELDLVNCHDPKHAAKYSVSSSNNYNIVPPLADRRFEIFAKRADNYFEHSNLVKHSLDVGDAYPGETPEAQSLHEQQYQHDDISGDTSGDFNFILVDGHVEMSPFHSYEDLLEKVGLDQSYQGPMALGTISVQGRTAFVSATGNIGANTLMKTLKHEIKARGWLWGGLTDLEGIPIDDETFMGKSSTRIYFSGTNNGDIELAHRLGILSSDSTIIGYLDVYGNCAKVQTLKLPTYPLSMRKKASRDMIKIGEALFEYCQDNDLQLISYYDNVVKTIEDLDQHNLYDPNPKGDDIQYPQKSDNGFSEQNQPFVCQHCNKAFDNWPDYAEHEQQEENMNPIVGDPINQEDGIQTPQSLSDTPSPNPKLIEMNDFTTQASTGYNFRPEGFRLPEDQYSDQYYLAYRGGPSAVVQLREGKVVGFDGEKQDVAYLFYRLGASGTKPWSPLKYVPPEIDAEIPFIYSVSKDTISFGQPGEQIAQIPGVFDQADSVTGFYQPDQSIILTSTSTASFSVHYFLQLFNSYQPQLEVKSVHMLDADGGDTRLAGAINV